MASQLAFSVTEWRKKEFLGLEGWTALLLLAALQNRNPY